MLKDIPSLNKLVNIMKKLQIIKNVSLIISMLGVILFWISGFMGHMELSKYALFGAGIAAWIALVAIIVKQLRARHFYY